ncbi:MAG TPA: metallophosphoesterase family protein, partial [Solirubrobacteraceae bacterium]|nr:metallophosphoesterase family protein [Solirubrobacteraceae bacterium]
MLVAIVSDIHGNRQAFESVLEEIADSDCQELWCLGDLVGYGADPDVCVELARRHASICLAGNHDLGVRGTLPLELFSRGAELAARWTQATITPRTREYLERLEPAQLDEAVGLYHASPRDPVWEYVLSALQAEL